MKEDKTQKIFDGSEQIKLSAEKKNSIRNEIVFFMKQNPYEKTQKRGFFANIFYYSKPAYVFIAAFALVLVVAGVTSAQAENALPGDILYPIKVGVNEKIKMVLAFSSKQKTNLAMQFANLRLQEAEKLATEGKITKQNQIQIEDNFEAQAKSVTNEIKNLNKIKKNDDAQKFSNDFQANLRDHGKKLESLGKLKDGDTLKNLNPLIDQINNTSEQLQKLSSKKIINQNNLFQLQNQPCLAQDNLYVTKVIDGDTVVAEGGSHVRLLGIDADEKGYPCYESAKTGLENLVLGKVVRFEKDTTDSDQYGRCLRYIFVGDTNVDTQMVKEGLAVARFYAPDLKYKSEISTAEDQAIAQKTGCKWSGQKQTNN